MNWDEIPEKHLIFGLSHPDIHIHVHFSIPILHSLDILYNTCIHHSICSENMYIFIVRLALMSEAHSNTIAHSSIGALGIWRVTTTATTVRIHDMMMQEQKTTQHLRWLMNTKNVITKNFVPSMSDSYIIYAHTDTQQMHAYVRNFQVSWVRGIDWVFYLSFLFEPQGFENASSTAEPDQHLVPSVYYIILLFFVVCIYLSENETIIIIMIIYILITFGLACTGVVDKSCGWFLVNDVALT